MAGSTMATFAPDTIDPLEKYQSNTELAMPGFNWDDFSKPLVDGISMYDGKMVSIPFDIPIFILMYRKDLFDKYGVKAPGTWDELAAGLKKVLDGEKNGGMNGVATTGAAIEGAVCTFLKPYWSQGKDFNDANGRMTLDKAAASKGLSQWLAMVDQGVIKKNVAEVKTPDTVNEFEAGQVVFAINWGFAWDRFKDDKDSTVQGKVGVMPLPAMAGGKSATCIGGWQWAVSAFSKHKAEAAKLVKHMAGAEASRFLAAEGALLPTQADVYTDATVLKQVPWFKDAAAVVSFGRSRPQSERYGEVSDALRTTITAPADQIALRVDAPLSPEDGPTRVEALIVKAANATAPGGSSIAALVDAAVADFRRCELIAGDAVDGTPGDPGGEQSPQSASGGTGAVASASGRSSRVCSRAPMR